MQAADIINLRISSEQKALIDEAAHSLGKSRTAFIIEKYVTLRRRNTS